MGKIKADPSICNKCKEKIGESVGCTRYDYCDMKLWEQFAVKIFFNQSGVIDPHLYDAILDGKMIIPRACPFKLEHLVCADKG